MNVFPPETDAQTENNFLVRIKTYWRAIWDHLPGAEQQLLYSAGNTQKHL